MKKITIVVHNDGRVEIDFSNYYGEECLKDLQRIVEILRTMGIEISIEKTLLKQEYYVENIDKIAQGEVK